MQFNKRGQELSVNTLILIIIGVLVLVFLIIGFTIGWQKIFPFITPGNTVKDVSDKCILSCKTQSSYDYCTTKREIRVDEPIDVLGDKFMASCYELKDVNVLGIEGCPSISCKDFVYSNKRLAELSCGTLPFVTATKEDAGAKFYNDTVKKETGYLKCAPQNA